MTSTSFPLLQSQRRNGRSYALKRGGTPRSRNARVVSTVATVSSSYQVSPSPSRSASRRLYACQVLVGMTTATRCPPSAGGRTTSGAYPIRPALPRTSAKYRPLSQSPTRIRSCPRGSGGSSGSLADDHAVHLVPPEPGDGHGSCPEDAEIDGAAGTGDDERHERAGRGTLAQEVGLDSDLRRRRIVGEPDGGGCDEKKRGDPGGNGQVATVPRLPGHVQRGRNVRRADTGGACPPPSRCRREAQKAGIRSRRRLTRRATATRTRLTAMPIAIPTPASSQSNPDGPVSGSACGRSTVAGPERGASVV